MAVFLMTLLYPVKSYTENLYDRSIIYGFWPIMVGLDMNYKQAHTRTETD